MTFAAEMFGRPPIADINLDIGNLAENLTKVVVYDLAREGLYCENGN